MMAGMASAATAAQGTAAVNAVPSPVSTEPSPAPMATDRPSDSPMELVAKVPSAPPETPSVLPPNRLDRLPNGLDPLPPNRLLMLGSPPLPPVAAWAKPEAPPVMAVMIDTTNGLAVISYSTESRYFFNASPAFLAQPLMPSMPSPMAWKKS